MRSRALIDRLLSLNFVRIHAIGSRILPNLGQLDGTNDRLPLELRAAYLVLHRCSDMRFAKLSVTADQFVPLATLARGQALTQREFAARMPDPTTVVAAELTANGN